jgi:hypothetical protein
MMGRAPDRSGLYVARAAVLKEANDIGLPNHRQSHSSRASYTAYRSSISAHRLIPRLVLSKLLKIGMINELAAVPAR